MEATMTMPRTVRAETLAIFASLSAELQTAFAIGVEAGKLQAESQQAENDRA